MAPRLSPENTFVLEFWPTVPFVVARKSPFACEVVIGLLEVLVAIMAGLLFMIPLVVPIIIGCCGVSEVEVVVGFSFFFLSFFGSIPNTCM